ncbi:MAG: DUF2490 domain-containing protein [Myxococcales bacterium]|nr:DUF2490 domain-containing protein [Myxococcales bacterium]
MVRLDLMTSLAPHCPTTRPVAAIAVLVAALLGAPQTASAFETDVKQDLALWSLAFVNHDFDDHWSVSFQTEVRVKDEVTSLDEAVFKAGGYYRFNDWLELGIGYNYIYKNDGANDNVAWEELYVRHPFQVFGFTHQVRLEQRFIQDISGTIPRLRYLVHVTTPLSPLFYFALSEAFRFNLVDKGTGPVSGFEQNRLYAGFGVHASKYLRVELGYLWRFELERMRPSKSDHVIRIQLHFATNGRHPSRGGS